jgi:phosphoserine phosphatase RsbU/P
VLGLFPADGIVPETLELHAGDRFVLFTDGVSEALDSNDDLFGEERLLAELHTMTGRGASETSRGVLEAVRRHAGGAQQSDDITVMSVVYAGRA